MSNLTESDNTKLEITPYESKNWYSYISLPKLDINSQKSPMYLLIVLK